MWILCIQLHDPKCSSNGNYIKDTKELLKAFYDFHWKSHYMWVTCDVVALFYQKAIAAFSYHLDKFSNYSIMLKQYILDITEFLLSNNYFFFFSGSLLFFVARMPDGSMFLPIIGKLIYELVGGGLPIYGQRSAR